MLVSSDLCVPSMGTVLSGFKHFVPSRLVYETMNRKTPAEATAEGRPTVGKYCLARSASAWRSQYRRARRDKGYGENRDPMNKNYIRGTTWLGELPAPSALAARQHSEAHWFGHGGKCSGVTAEDCAITWPGRRFGRSRPHATARAVAPCAEMRWVMVGLFVSHPNCLQNC